MGVASHTRQNTTGLQLRIPSDSDISGISPNPFRLDEYRKDEDMANRTRKHNFYLRLSEDEAYILEEKFKASGMKNRSEFFRHLLLYGYVYDVDYSVVQENNYQLQKIGTNIMQVVKKLNTYGNVYRKDIDEIKALMEEIWRTQVSTQSKLQYKNQ